MSSAIQDLYAQREQAVKNLTAAKESLAKIESKILEQHESSLRAIYQREGKEHGSVRLLVEDIEVYGEVGKDVKWDSGALRDVASGMSWEEAQRVFKITFEVPEKIYKTLNDELRSKVDKARSVVYGKLKVSLMQKGSDQ